MCILVLLDVLFLKWTYNFKKLILFELELLLQKQTFAIELHFVSFFYYLAYCSKSITWTILFF